MSYFDVHNVMDPITEQMTLFLAPAKCCRNKETDSGKERLYFEGSCVGNVLIFQTLKQKQELGHHCFHFITRCLQEIYNYLTMYYDSEAKYGTDYGQFDNTMAFSDVSIRAGKFNLG